MQSNGSDSSAGERAPAQQQWVPTMQYPAAAMVMQHQMMPPPPYMAYHPHHYQPHHGHGHNQSSSSSSSADNKTLWVGDLHHWMDENYLHTCFASTGEILSIKIIRNKQTGLSEGYGFVEFFSHSTAEKVLQNYGGIFMPNMEQPFRLNWASFSTGEKRGSDNNSNGGSGTTTSDLSIFVGDLAADVTDAMLLETFSVKYPSVKGVKVVFDANTGRSKGYGFVRFGDEAERSQAMTEMNGVYCSTRAMRIGAATPRKSSSGYQHGGYNGALTQGFQPEGDSSNTTIFVGGLDPSVTDEDLRQPFAEIGEIVSVKIPTGKGCGFVQFASRDNAEEALQKLNGTVIGTQTVRLSWGRNPANKQYRGDFGNQWGGGAYYGGQVYDGYGYGAPSPHEYGGYPVYQQQVN